MAAIEVRRRLTEPCKCNEVTIFRLKINVIVSKQKFFLKRNCTASKCLRTLSYKFFLHQKIFERFFFRVNQILDKQKKKLINTCLPHLSAGLLKTNKHTTLDMRPAIPKNGIQCQEYKFMNVGILFYRCMSSPSSDRCQREVKNLVGPFFILTKLTTQVS